MSFALSLIVCTAHPAGSPLVAAAARCSVGAAVRRNSSAITSLAQTSRKHGRNHSNEHCYEHVT